MTNQQQLKQLMADHNLSIQDTAALLGYTEAAIYHWLNGTRKMPDPILELLTLKLKE